MIHKVTVETAIGMGMTIHQSFESIVDNEEEAEKFGEEANHIFTGFMNGWGVGADDSN